MLSTHDDQSSQALETTPDVIFQEPEDVYRSKAGEYLSSHLLANFRRCPLLYRQKVLGLIEDVDRPAYLEGRAAHTLILEGEAKFNARYAVGGPINPKTGQPFGSQTKAYAEWAAECGKEVLTETQADVVRKMAAGVREHHVAAELFASGIAEGVARTEYCGVPCQIRMDFFDLYRGIIDLKTCDDLDWFEADARRYGYLYQLAFYYAVLREVIGVGMTVYLVAVEKKVPFRCGVWRVHTDPLRAATRENEAAIARLKTCQATDTWPTGYAEIRYFDAL